MAAPLLLLLLLLLGPAPVAGFASNTAFVVTKKDKNKQREIHVLLLLPEQLCRERQQWHENDNG